MPVRTNRLLLAVVAGAITVGAVIAAVLLLTGGEHEEAGVPPETEPGPGGTPESPSPEDRILVAKIDNVPAARPQTGLDIADVIYVEPVEGGQTRLAAVYSSDLPETIGPVRSARETDIELLVQYGRPTLVYSGAAPEIVPLLQDSPLNTVPHSEEPEAYLRDPDRLAPHNLYVHPDELPEGSGAGPHQVLEFGEAPPGGVPETEYTVRYPTDVYQLHWSQESGEWMISIGGSPLQSTGSGQVGVPTVVVQEVDIEEGSEVTDAGGVASPVIDTVGSGSVTVLRNGTEYSGTWSRPTEGDGTRFTTEDGEPLPLAEGPVWILLVPR